MITFDAACNDEYETKAAALCESIESRIMIFYFPWEKMFNCRTCASCHSRCDYVSLQIVNISMASNAPRLSYALHG